MKMTSLAYHPQLAATAATAAYRGTTPPGLTVQLRPHPLPDSVPAFWQNRRLLEFGRPV